MEEYKPNPDGKKELEVEIQRRKITETNKLQLNMQQRVLQAINN